MKNLISLSSKNNDLGGQFKSLNNQEMLCLKGGVKPIPPIPPTGGDDYPIILTAQSTTTSTTLAAQQLPVLSTDTSSTSI